MKLEIGASRTALEYDLCFRGRDLCVHIHGGTAHIGSVSAAEGETVKTTVFLGHKENYLTEPLAKALAKALNCRVVVTAGVHLGQITAEEIQIILAQNKKMAEQMIAALKNKG